MDELDHRSELMLKPATIVKGARRQYHEGWPQAFAPTADDVLGHLADERDLRSQTAPDDLIHRAHVCRDEFAYRLECHASRHRRALMIAANARLARASRWLA